MERGLRRGDVWWVDLGEPRGRAPAFKHPVLIVQDDLLTDSRLGTVMVVPLTSNLQRAQAIGNVALKGRETGLSEESVALVCQMITVDKDSFTEPAGRLSSRSMHKIDAGLALAACPSR